jgi:hypothetical protein
LRCVLCEQPAKQPRHPRRRSRLGDRRLPRLPRTRPTPHQRTPTRSRHPATRTTRMTSMTRYERHERLAAAYRHPDRTQSRQSIEWFDTPIALPGTSIRVVGFDTAIGLPDWVHETDTTTIQEPTSRPQRPRRIRRRCQAPTNQEPSRYRPRHAAAQPTSQRPRRSRAAPRSPRRRRPTHPQRHQWLRGAYLKPLAAHNHPPLQGTRRPVEKFNAPRR